MKGFYEWLSPTIDPKSLDLLTNHAIRLVWNFSGPSIWNKAETTIEDFDGQTFSVPIEIEIFGAKLTPGKIPGTRHPNDYTIEGTEINKGIKIEIGIDKNSIEKIPSLINDIKKDLQFVISHELGHAQRYIPNDNKYNDLSSGGNWNKYQTHPIEMEATMASIASAYERINHVPNLEELLDMSVTPGVKIALLSSPKRRRALLQRLAREGFVTREMTK